MSPKIIGLVPARSGSKSVPHKNIKPILGRPLIVYTIEQALKSAYIDRVIVSTDSQEYANLAIQHGAEVPFLRPEKISKDETGDLPVYNHLINYLKTAEGYKPDYVVWLRPTAPLRTTDDINAAISLAIKTNVDCVRSVCIAEHHPYWMKSIVNSKLIPFLEGKDEKTYYQRQLLPALYRVNGAVEVFSTDFIRVDSIYEGEMTGYVMPVERSLDIDTELDFILAEVLIERFLSND